MQTDTEGFTQQAMPQQNGGHGLFVQFYEKPIQDDAKTVEAGRPIFNEKTYVKIIVPGDKTSVIERPMRKGHTQKHDNIKFAREYEAYTAGVEQTPEGTPLSEWPLMSQSQVKELEFFNVHTVEQLASMADTNVQNFLGVAKLRTQARAFMENAKDNAGVVKMQAELDKRDAKLDAQQKQIDEMMGMLQEKTAPKKRGKPAKEG